MIWARIVAASESGDPLRELLAWSGDGVCDIRAYYANEGFLERFKSHNALELLSVVMGWTIRELHAQVGARSEAIEIIRAVLLTLADEKSERPSRSVTREAGVSISGAPYHDRIGKPRMEIISFVDVQRSEILNIGNVDRSPTRNLESEGNIMDRIVRALADAGYPMGISLLVEKVGGGIDSADLKRKIGIDARFIRSDVDMWALAEWGMPAYKPIRDLIADLVDGHGGAISSNEVVRVLTRDFSIKESSLRQAMSSPPFGVRDGMVRRLSDVENGKSHYSHAIHDGSGDEDGPSADDLIGLMGL
ncbi:hypothetical protein ACFQBS_22540 [Planomonospora parontospora]|uniref:hypothetical protein n=1 Tax=Planomonospora parontospora TaxID=58119 RepID=UPI0036141049